MGIPVHFSFQKPKAITILKWLFNMFIPAASLAMLGGPFPLAEFREAGRKATKGGGELRRGAEKRGSAKDLAD